MQKVKLVDNFYWFLTGTIGTPARNGWHQLPGQGGFLNRYIHQGFRLSEKLREIRQCIERNSLKERPLFWKHLLLRLEFIYFIEGHQQFSLPVKQVIM